MSSFSNQNKTAAITATNQSVNTSTMKPYVKAGEGLPYDSDAAYDGEFDPISGNPLFYNTAGTTPTWVNQSKS